MKCENLGTPCRNYAFLCAEYIPCDPKDGHEKYLLASGTYVIFIDAQTLTGESYEMPSQGTIWDMMYLPEYERLLVATSSGQMGRLHSLDLRSRTWGEPLGLEGQLYIWNLTIGGDGLIYGSNWPGSLLLCYDPVAHTLVSKGRVGNNPENTYARMVYTLPDGNILISVGLKERETWRYDITAGTFTQVLGQGDYAEAVTDELIMTTKNGTYCFYDPRTFELLDQPVKELSLEGLTHPAVIGKVKEMMNPPYAHLLPYKRNCQMRTLKDGRVIGYFNQQYFIIEKDKIEFRDVPVLAPPMAIFSLAVDPDGVVWFAASLGQGIGFYNPKTGESWNSAAVTRVNGEVYGIVPHEGLIYLTAYAGGDHIVYDPKKPWDQFHNVNPKTLRSVAPQKMGRPVAGSILGPDGNIWSGWCAIYGIYGGGVSRIDTRTLDVDSWYGLVPEQCIGYMTAGKEYIYATSHWMNSGLPYRFDDAFWLLRLDMECNVVWKEQFKPGQFPECLVVVDGKLFMSMRDRLDDMAKLVVYDEQTMEKCAVVSLGHLGGPGRCEMEKKAVRALLAYDEEHLVALIDDQALLISALTFEIVQAVQLPGMASLCAIAPDKSIYISIGENLYRVLFD